VLPPFNRCGAAVIAIASLVERLACGLVDEQHRQRTFGDWRDVLDYIKVNVAGGHFRSNGEDRWPSNYLELDDKQRVGLTGRNVAKSFSRLEAAVRATLTAYLRDTAPLGEFCKVQDSDLDASVATFLRAAVAAFSALTDRGAFQRLVDKVSPTHFPDRIVEHLVENMFRGIAIPRHPDFGSLSLLDELLVKSEFFSIRSNVDGGTDVAALARGTFNLYAVLREARGWAVERPSERNMIVRDLLWIRPSTGRTEYTQDDYERNREFIGIYVSAIDKICFYIERIELHGHEVILTAREERHGSTSQRLMLMFPASTYTHALQPRFGIIAGSAGTEHNLAAWKCTLIRPDWQFFRQLRTIMSQIRPVDINKLYRICSDVSAAGIYFSRDAREKDESRELMQNRRDAFRRVVASHPDGQSQSDVPAFAQFTLGGFLTDKVASDVTSGLEEYISDNEMQITNKVIDGDWRDVIPELTNRIIQSLNTIAREQHHLIEPAQIVNFRKEPPTESQTDMPLALMNDIKFLLDTNQIDQRF
jgi:hypothetical protein